MSTLSTFMTSPSGYVSRREGLSLGWMAGAIAGTAVVFGMASPAAAISCPGGTTDCGTVCSNDPCSTNKLWLDRYCNFGFGCVYYDRENCVSTC